MAEPLVLHLPDELVSQGYLEIIDVGSGKRVITVIEVLSLANKQPGEGQDLYLQKQRELIDGEVSLVEIDLLRTGRRVISIPLSLIPASRRTTYQVCVPRGWQPLVAEVYPAPLREQLPVIRIPLRESDPDVLLDLQALLDQCYRNSGYDDDIDYTRDPDPPLAVDDAKWADALLQQKGHRPPSPPPAQGTGRRDRKKKS